MNIKYILQKDKALVLNEYENITTRAVTTNLKKILKTENKMEFIKRKLCENDVGIKKNKLREKNFKLMAMWSCPACLLCGILAGNLSFLIDLIAIHLELVNVVLDYKTMLQDLVVSVKISSLLGLSGGLIASLFSLSKHKKIKKERESMEFENFFLESCLDDEREKLTQLRENDQPLELEREEIKLIYINNKKIRNKYREYLLKLAFYGTKIKKYNKMLNEERVELRTKMRNDGVSLEVFDRYLINYNTRKLRKDKERL